MALSVNANVSPSVISGGSVVPCCLDVSLSCKTGGDLSGRFEMDVITNPADQYEGAYIAIPSFDVQTFETSGLLMKDDFEVEKIPVFTTPNEYGDTVTIGVIYGD